MATPFEYIGLGLAVFGALAKLPSVVHTIRNVRAYDNAKRTKKSRASRLLELVDEAEKSVEKLRRVRRNGRRLVPRPLVRDFRRLTKLCGVQADAYLDYNRKMYIVQDPAYRWKHVILAALGLCNKGRRLARILSDCELWLIVTFYTINLYVLKHSWDAQRDVDVRLLEKLLSQNLRLARNQKAESSHRQSMRVFERFKVRVEVFERDAETILNQSSSTLSDDNPWMRNPMSGDAWGRGYASGSHDGSDHVYDVRITRESQPDSNGGMFVNCPQRHETQQPRYQSEYGAEGSEDGYGNHEQNNGYNHDMPPPSASFLHRNEHSTVHADAAQQYSYFHTEDMRQRATAGCRQTASDRNDHRDGNYHHREPEVAAKERHRERRRRARDRSETASSSPRQSQDSHHEDVDRPRPAQMASPDRVLWNGNIYIPHPVPLKDNDSGYGGSMPSSPSQSHASPVLRPTVFPEGDRHYPPRTPYIRRAARSSSSGSRGSSSGYESN